jgi:hypothetical protein
MPCTISKDRATENRDGSSPTVPGPGTRVRDLALRETATEDTRGRP